MVGGIGNRVHHKGSVRSGRSISIIPLAMVWELWFSKDLVPVAQDAQNFQKMTAQRRSESQESTDVDAQLARLDNDLTAIFLSFISK